MRKRPQMQEFQQTLEECNLVDLGFRGPKYTWSNCREGRAIIKERLDRGVANMEWRTWFPAALVSVEAAVSSDHAPLILSLKKIPKRKKGNKHFRYEAAWALEDGCKEVIATVWGQEQMQPLGWDRLNHKLNACMQKISLWKETLQGPKLRSLSCMREKLAQLQGLEDMGNSNQIAHLKRDIQLQLEKDDLWWRQRAKVEWLKHGDRNTRYFHACVNSRRRKNNIEKIKDENGQWWSSNEDVGKAFIDYYTNLFSAGREGDLRPCLQNIDTRVTERMNMELMAEFSMEEISEALNHMAPLKAPGPDGMNACFFQKIGRYWERRYVVVYLIFLILELCLII
jgi:hypothetical protein